MDRITVPTGELAIAERREVTRNTCSKSRHRHRRRAPRSASAEGIIARSSDRDDRRWDAAVLAAGGVTGYLALKRVDQIATECPNDQCPTGYDLDGAQRRARTLTTLTDVDGFIGRMAEVRITEHLTEHVVGLYRTVRIDTAVLDAVVPGCVDLDTEYDVDVYVDANGNDRYDNPTSPDGDRGWRLSSTSGVTGLELTLDVRLPGAGDGNVDVGEP